MKIGFANTVRAYGDDWRTGGGAALKRARAPHAKRDAMLMASGGVTDEQRENLRMSSIVQGWCGWPRAEYSGKKP